MNVIITLLVRHIIPKLMPLLFGFLKELLYKYFEEDKDKRKHEIVERIKEKGQITNQQPIIHSDEKYHQVEEHLEEEKSDNRDQLTDLEKAILELDLKNEKHWAYYKTKRQRPDLDAIELFLDYRPSVKEVTEAWKNINGLPSK